MENLLKLSASGVCSFNLAEAKEKSVYVCVRCKTTNCICVGGRAGSSRENGISPWHRGVTPTVAVPEGAGEELFTFLI